MASKYTCERVPVDVPKPACCRRCQGVIAHYAVEPALLDYSVWSRVRHCDADGNEVGLPVTQSGFSKWVSFLNPSALWASCSALRTTPSQICDASEIVKISVCEFAVLLDAGKGSDVLDSDYGGCVHTSLMLEAAGKIAPRYMRQLIDTLVAGLLHFYPGAEVSRRCTACVPGTAESVDRLWGLVVDDVGSMVMSMRAYSESVDGLSVYTKAIQGEADSWIANLRHPEPFQGAMVQAAKIAAERAREMHSVEARRARAWAQLHKFNQFVQGDAEVTLASLADICYQWELATTGSSPNESYFNALQSRSIDWDDRPDARDRLYARIRGDPRIQRYAAGLIDAAAAYLRNLKEA